MNNKTEIKMRKLTKIVDDIFEEYEFTKVDKDKYWQCAGMFVAYQWNTTDDLPSTDVTEAHEEEAYRSMIEVMQKNEVLSEDGDKLIQGSLELAHLTLLEEEEA